MNIENQNNPTHWKSRVHDMQQVDGQPADLGGLWNKLDARLPEKKVSYKKSIWLAAAALILCMMAVYFLYDSGKSDKQLVHTIPSANENSLKNIIPVEKNNDPSNATATNEMITASNKRLSVHKQPASPAGPIITTTQPTTLQSSSMLASTISIKSQPDSSSLSIAHTMQVPAHDIPVPLFASKKLKVVHINELQPADANQVSIENDPGYRSIRIKLMRQQTPDMSATNQSPSENIIKIKLPQK